MPFRILGLDELKPLESDMVSFLALNGISGADWEKMKIEKPELVDDYIRQFSDLVWMKILTAKQFINLKEGDTSYFYHFMSNEVSVFKVTKHDEKADAVIGRLTAPYEESREVIMYGMLEAGGVFSDGKEYKEVSLLWASHKNAED